MKEKILRMVRILWRIEDFVEFHKRVIGPRDMVCPWCGKHLVIRIDGVSLPSLCALFKRMHEPNAKVTASCDCDGFGEAESFSRLMKRGELHIDSSKKITLGELVAKAV
ncbi:MAG: hypothetical protein PHN74_03105 [Candidatus Pacebacteria bacterium]|nr:hypothetical protein [Candidatus Paceibacterota bacterium]